MASSVSKKGDQGGIHISNAMMPLLKRCLISLSEFPSVERDFAETVTMIARSSQLASISHLPFLSAIVSHGAVGGG